MAQRTVSIRLSPEGGPEIKRLFDEVATGGDASAQRLARSYQRAGEDIEAAIQRQANAAAKIAAIMPQSSIQMRVDSSVSTGFGQYEGSAKRSALAMRDLLAAEEALEERTRRLVASLNPAAAAQDRFNREMDEAQDLISRGAITLDQYVAKLGQERAALDQATGAKMRGATSAGALRQATLGASYQVQDLFTQISMGANPINALTVQSMQLAGQFAAVEGRAGAFARVLIGPWGLAVSGGLLLLGMLTKGLFDNSEASAKAEQGMADFQRRQSDIGRFIDMTTGKLKEQNRELILNAIITRENAIRQQQDTIRDARTAAFSAARGATLRTTAAAPGSTTSGVSFTDDTDVQAAIRGANGSTQRLTENLRQLATTTRPELRGLVVEVSNLGAQAADAEREGASLRRELAALNGDTRVYAGSATDAAGAAGEAARAIGNSGSAATLAGDAAQDAANANLALARAYLAGGVAAVRAEADQRGFAEAVSEGVAAGARSLDQLREETAARAAVRAQVLAGTLPIEQMDRALQDEAALRPLLKLQLVAQGDAQAVLTRVIDEYRTALAAAHDEEGRSQAEQRINDATERALELRSVLSDLALTDYDQAYNAAGRAAQRAADKETLAVDDPKRAQAMRAALDEVDADFALRRGQAADQMRRSQQDALDMADAELRLVGLSDDRREAGLARQRLILDLRRSGVAAESDEGRAILATNDVLDAKLRLLDRQQAGWAALKDVGSDFVETVLSPETWDDWGKGGKRILDILKAEFIRLTLLNPIKNMLFGENNATLSDVLGNVTKLFGGSGGASPKGTAAGTSYFSGGAMLAGEFGPELLWAPRGTQVAPAGETRRLLAANDGGRAPVIKPYFDMRGAIVTADLMADIDQKMAIAAAQGAAGGADMAEVSMEGRSRRQLGRRW